MKKIIGILGIAVIAATIFFNTNAVNDYSTDSSLASLMTLNKAHADYEGGEGPGTGTATVPCKDTEANSGLFSVRACNGCKWVSATYIATPNTCIINY